MARRQKTANARAHAEKTEQEAPLEVGGIDFYRIMIYFLGAAILVFGGLLVWHQYRIRQYEDEIPRALRQLVETTRLYAKIRDLNREIEDLGGAVDSTPNAYIYDKLQKGGVDVRQAGIEIGSAKAEPNRAGGYVDETYTIRFRNRDYHLPREYVAFFLWKIEEHSKYAVTQVNMMIPPKKRIEDDVWQVDYEVTLREPLRASPK